MNEWMNEMYTVLDGECLTDWLTESIMHFRRNDTKRKYNDIEIPKSVHAARWRVLFIDVLRQW